MPKKSLLSLLGGIACFGGALAGGQVETAPRRTLTVPMSECAKGAICFSGEVREGGEFRKHLTSTLDFVIRLPGGIDVVSTAPQDPCKLSAWIANPPLRAHHDTEIDAEYDWTAEDEIRANPRQFRFATNCADFNRLLKLSETDAGKYFDELPTRAPGHGRLWVMDSKVTHLHARSISRTARLNG